MRVVDHSFYSDVVGNLQRRNIARLRQRPSQRDGAFKFVIVVMRSVRSRLGLKSDGFIYNRVVRSCALIDGGSVNVGFERRPYLQARRRRPLELWSLEVSPT